MIKRLLCSTLLYGVLFSATASASVLFTLERTSDSVATLTGTGTLDTGVGLGQSISFLGASATIGDTGLDGFGGDFAIGGTQPSAVFIRAGETNFILVGNASPWSIGDGPTGSAIITLDVETWAAIGTTGNLVIEGTSTVLGSYQIVAASEVPEPGTMSMFGLGGAMLLVAYRKRKK